MFVTRQNIFIKSSPAVVWEHVYNVKSWPEWIRSIRGVELLETPKLNAKGKLYFKNQKITIFNIASLETKKSIQIEMPLFWSEMTFDVRLLDIDGGTAVTIEAHANGLWEKVIFKLLGRRLGKVLEENLRTLNALINGFTEDAPRVVANQ